MLSFISQSRTANYPTFSSFLISLILGSGNGLWVSCVIWTRTMPDSHLKSDFFTQSQSNGLTKIYPKPEIHGVEVANYRIEGNLFPQGEVLTLDFYPEKFCRREKRIFQNNQISNSAIIYFENEVDRRFLSL